MEMLRVTAVWTGFMGAPGYSNFFFAGGGGLISDAAQVAERVRDAFVEINNELPSSVNITVQSEVARIESDTGEIVGYHDAGDFDPVVGIHSGSYSAASGAVVHWTTDDLRYGRRIRGRTFVVPLAGDSYESDGTLTAGALTNLRAFADTLVSWDFDSEFGVWSRPTGGSGGVFASATGYRVPDMAAVLRSRRD